MAAEPPTQDHDPTAVERLLRRQRDGWSRGERLLVEALVEDHPTLANDRERLLDLVWNEVDLRAARGEAPQLDEYQKRFPELSDDLRRQFEVFAARRPTVRRAESNDCGAGATAAQALAPSGGEPVPPPKDMPPPEIAGYEILGVLGRGGMGIVYKARQTAADRVVALKMILGGFADDEARARFRTEAQAVAALQHPNIVQVFEVGEHRGQPFFSLELCGGGSLEGRLRATPLPPAEAARLVQTLARAMHQAHERGIIHRDLKPANVLLTQDGTPKITDFGLAKKLDDVGRTQTGAVMGTPSYMAPEQASGELKALGPAADVYALGAILYECLTGRPPFKAATLLDTLVQVRNDDPVPPRQLQSKTPRDLDYICLKCLSKRPQGRYASAAETADDLQRFLDGKATVARPVGRVARVGRWRRRRPLVAALRAGLAAAIALGFTGVSLEWRDALNQERQKDQQRQRAEESAGLEKAARQTAQDAEGRAVQALQQEKKTSYLRALLLSDREWESNQAGPAEALLDACPEELRCFVWYYLKRRCHEDRFTYRGHADKVAAVAYSPDGSRIASGGADKVVRVWEPGGGKEVAALRGHRAAVLCVAYSPDGRRLASRAADGAIKVWDARNLEREPLALRAGSGRVVGTAFSPDGRALAAAGLDRAVRLYDVESGALLRTLEGHRGPVFSVAFTTDGRRLASGGDDARSGGEVKVWDVDTGQPLLTLADEDGGVRGLVFSPDNRRLYCADQSGVRVWGDGPQAGER